MQERLTIDVARLKPGGEDIEGEVDAIDIAEDLVHPFGGIRYSLNAQVIGSELLVRGRAEQDFDLVCSRCGRDFDTTIKCEDFTTSVELDGNADEIDLTDEIREAILLELPNYPLCDENCAGLAGAAGGGNAEGKESTPVGAMADGVKESVWDALTGLASK